MVEYFRQYLGISAFTTLHSLVVSATMRNESPCSRTSMKGVVLCQASPELRHLRHRVSASRKRIDQLRPIL